MSISPKATSFEYGELYQLEQVDKHRNRHVNHWKARVSLAHKLIDKFVLPKLPYSSPDKIRTLDVGCSIGTMAIEMAHRGFLSFGVDFDEAALCMARKLAEEEQVKVQFFQCDVAELSSSDDRRFDIAICFDIFEHLHDDELGALLQSIRRQLDINGALVFYTFPLQFDYLFYSREFLHWPLIPFKWLPTDKFERIVRAYAKLLDVFLLIGTGQSYQDRISRKSHCNPTTKRRLENMLHRAGYSLDIIESTNIYPFKEHVMNRFCKQPMAHRNLYGVARPKKNLNLSD